MANPSRCRERAVGIMLWTFVLLSAVGQAQTRREFTGKIKPELAATTSSFLSLKVTLLGDRERNTLPSPLAKSALAFGGTMAWADGAPESAVAASAKATQVVLVEPANGLPYLWADCNGNGVFEPDERFLFSALTGKPGTLQTTIWVGPFSGLFRRYPYVVRYSPADRRADERLLRTSIDTVAEASVDMDGRQTLVQIGVRPPDGGRLRLDRAPGVFLGIDGNGDGRIDVTAASTEFAWVRPGEDAVFSARETYVSVKSIDERARTIVLRERDASDYLRISLTEGVEIPNFTFTDFTGASRKLSDFRGQYILLDFWGTWCGPCIGQFPELKTLYQSFHTAGFEIIGMDVEQPDDTPEQAASGLKRAKELVAERGLPWPQATTNSIRDLAYERFRVSVWPTTLLLDRAGRLVWMSAGPDRPAWGDTLKPTLEKLLGKR